MAKAELFRNGSIIHLFPHIQTHTHKLCILSNGGGRREGTVSFYGVSFAFRPQFDMWERGSGGGGGPINQTAPHTPLPLPPCPSSSVAAKEEEEEKRLFHCIVRRFLAALCFFSQKKKREREIPAPPPPPRTECERKICRSLSRFLRLQLLSNEREI